MAVYHYSVSVYQRSPDSDACDQAVGDPVDTFEIDREAPTQEDADETVQQFADSLAEAGEVAIWVRSSP